MKTKEKEFLVVLSGFLDIRIKYGEFDEVFKLIGLSLKQQVAHVHNRMDATEEEIDNALSPLSLTACAANKDFIVDRLKSKFSNKDAKINNWPVKNKFDEFSEVI